MLQSYVLDVPELGVIVSKAMEEMHLFISQYHNELGINVVRVAAEEYYYSDGSTRVPFNAFAFDVRYNGNPVPMLSLLAYEVITVIGDIGNGVYNEDLVSVYLHHNQAVWNAIFDCKYSNDIQKGIWHTNMCHHPEGSPWSSLWATYINMLKSIAAYMYHALMQAGWTYPQKTNGSFLTFPVYFNGVDMVSERALVIRF